MKYSLSHIIPTGANPDIVNQLSTLNPTKPIRILEKEHNCFPFIQTSILFLIKFIINFKRL